MKPFLKWPGGKRRVLPQLRPFFPSDYGTYREGFVGGGAVLFDIAPERAAIYDVNSELIKTYRAIRDELPALLDLLEGHKTGHTQGSKDYFYGVRALDRSDGFLENASDVEIAARMIYLNRTCFNGLYRVNSKNQFNAPFGDYKNPKIVDHENLAAVSSFLRDGHVELSDAGYEKAVADTVAGDFVYLDPPYVPASATASFVGYAKDGFNMDDQRALADSARKMDEAGAYVLSSNSDTEATRELYEGFTIVSIDVLRSIGASVKTRKGAGEVVIVGKTLAGYLGL